MKLNEINQKEEVLTEGLVQVLGKVLKYTFYAITGYIVYRIVKAMIRGLFSDDKKEEDRPAQKQTYFLVPVHTGIQTKEGIGKVNDRFEDIAAEIADASGASRHNTEVKIYRDTKNLPNFDESKGRVYVVVHLFAFDDPYGVNDVKRIVNKIDDKYGIEYQVDDVKRYKV